MDISKLKSMLSDAQAYWAATHNSYTTDLKFSYGIGQWDSKVESARRRAKRLVETYNIVQAFITPVVNAVREAPPGVDIKPIANADKMQARALSGLVRTIEQDSGAGSIYCNALDNLCRGGLGAWRVVICKDHHGEDTIKVEMVEDPTCIYFDPAARALDFYDARYVIYKNVMSKDEYIEQYGKDDTIQDDDISVYVWEMWYREDDGHIKLYIFDDNRIIDEQDLEICHLPYILITADRMSIDGKVTYNSAIRDIKPLQKEINFLKSEAMTVLANAPKAQFIAQQGTLINPQSWANAAADPNTVLEYAKNASVAPQPIAPPPPPVGYMEAATSNLDLMRQITGIYPDASVQSALAGASGKAIKTQIAVGQIASKQWLEALQIGIRYGGDVILDYISVYYGDDAIRVATGADMSITPISIGPTPIRGAVNVDMSNGKYKVVISTGASYATAIEQATDRIMEIGKANPQVFQILTDWLVQNTNIPGSEELADRFRAILPPEVQQVIAQTQSGDPYDVIRNQNMQMQQMAAQVQQAMQQIQGLQMELQKATDLRTLEQEKIQGKIVQAQIENTTKIGINDDNIRAKMTLQDDQQAHEVRMSQLESKLDLLVASVGSIVSKLA